MSAVARALDTGHRHGPVLSEKILSQHIAILGKAGSGKTYTAKGIAEGLLSAGKRVCIIDPTGVWWGLRSNVAGKKAAFPIVVFGGEHSDVPLTQGHGAAIAEIIGTTDTSAVLDTRMMSVGERTRFFSEFAETLLRKNRGPLHLIIDEAHVFAPQGRVNDPQSGKMLHAANNLVSLGRSAGLRIILITQRPAKLHKDSLTQAETLIALRLIAPQDRKAVEDWIGEWADAKQGKEIIASLPSLPTGRGWVWSPESDVLECVTFPKITTYDSSRAPTGDRAEVVLANIDLPTIQKRLDTVAKDVLENDPKRLRAQIAELQKAKPTVDEAQIAQRLAKARSDGWNEGHAAATEAMKLAAREVLEAEQRMSEAVSRMMELRSQKPPPAHASTAAPIRNMPVPVKSTGSSESVKGLGQRVLTILANYPGGRTKKQIALMAEVSAKGGYFNNTMGSLRSQGLIEGVAEVKITAAGLATVGPVDPLPTGPELVERWKNSLGGLHSRVLTELLSVYPSELSKEDLASRVGAEPRGGYFNNTMGKLRTLDLVVGTQSMRLSDDVMTTN